MAAADPTLQEIFAAAFASIRKAELAEKAATATSDSTRSGKPTEPHSRLSHACARR
jgi:hypothetical protein